MVFDRPPAGESWILGATILCDPWDASPQTFSTIFFVGLDTTSDALKLLIKLNGKYLGLRNGVEWMQKASEISECNSDGGGASIGLTRTAIKGKE